MLALGDVHLGTRPARLPADLVSWGVDPAELTPEAAFTAAIERAVAEGVDAVLFAGDVVESSNARFEALRPLEAGVRRLVAAGIPVLAVAGNHDVDALPRLARLIDGFELLGEGGRWQPRLLKKHGRPFAEILGWSFPERQVRTSPVAQFLRSPITSAVAGVARIGLLHGDLDASGGTYAPFRRHELAEAGLDAWLLGHIHRASLSGDPGRAGDVPCGYLGSLVGLDPTETGPHGPWRIEIDAVGRVVPEQLAIAPLRWETLDVSVAEVSGPEDVGDRLLDEAERLARGMQEQGTAPRVLGLRIRLVGESCYYDAIRQRIESGEWNGISRNAADTLVFVDQVSDGLSLRVDLEEIAQGADPPALLAKKLLGLYRGGEQRQALLAEARMALRPLAEEGCWTPLSDGRAVVDPVSDEALVGLLRQSGTAALNALLAQRRDREGASS